MGDEFNGPILPGKENPMLKMVPPGEPGIKKSDVDRMNEQRETEEREELEAERYATEVRYRALTLSVAHLGGAKSDDGYNSPETIIEVANVYLRYMLGENLDD